jgi:hypothetical protein
MAPRRARRLAIGRTNQDGIVMIPSMPDMSGLFPVAVATLLLLGTRLLGATSHQRSPNARRPRTRRRYEAWKALWRRRIGLTPTLAFMWALFLFCNAILFSQDPLYAISLMMTAASSIKLRRVYAGGRADQQRIAARAS